MKLPNFSYILLAISAHLIVIPLKKGNIAAKCHIKMKSHQIMYTVWFSLFVSRDLQQNNNKCSGNASSFSFEILLPNYLSIVGAGRRRVMSPVMVKSHIMCVCVHFKSDTISNNNNYVCFCFGFFFLENF